jgi:hypothetical protein
MNYFIPSFFAIAWIIICVLLLLMPSTPFEIALMGLALIILHKDSGENLKNKKDINETRIVEAGAGLIVLVISFCFIIYAVAVNYGVL